MNEPKTPGERVVEEWVKDWDPPQFSRGKSAIDLSHRIDTLIAELTGKRTLDLRNCRDNSGLGDPGMFYAWCVIDAIRAQLPDVEVIT